MEDREHKDHLPPALEAILAGLALLLAWAGASAALFAAGAGRPLPRVLPPFAPELSMALALCLISIAAYCAAMTLLWPCRKAWPKRLLPSAAATAIACLLCLAASRLAGHQPLALAAACLWVTACALSARLARRVSLAASLCIVPHLLLALYVVALLYALVMLNP